MIAHEVLYKANKITYNNKKLYYYLQRENSIMGKKFNINRLDILDAMKDRTDFFMKNNLKELQFKAEYEYLKVLFRLYFIMINEDENIKLRLKEIKNEFNSVFCRILKNPNYNMKEKVSIAIFYINPKIYKKLILD